MTEAEQLEFLARTLQVKPEEIAKFVKQGMPREGRQFDLGQCLSSYIAHLQATLRKDEARRCEKCGADKESLSLRYCTGDVEDSRACIEGEHLHQRCAVCGYELVRPTLTEPAAEPANADLTAAAVLIPGAPPRQEARSEYEKREIQNPATILCGQQGLFRVTGPTGEVSLYEVDGAIGLILFIGFDPECDFARANASRPAAEKSFCVEKIGEIPSTEHERVATIAKLRGEFE